ncbi:MAG: hypothetical protein HF967_07160 [Methanosarcinales archaeon]|nr:hypothetical protein [Methanosarcinales archaeon]
MSNEKSNYIIHIFGIVLLNNELYGDFINKRGKLYCIIFLDKSWTCPNPFNAFHQSLQKSRIYIVPT